MPDLERLTDSLREFAAVGPERQAFERGYTKGKTAARLELAAVAAAFAVAVVLVRSLL